MKTINHLLNQYFPSDLIFKIVLSLGFLLHGLWNLESDSIQWWTDQGNLFPMETKYFLGGIEILLVGMLWIVKLQRISLVLIAGIMISAIFVTFQNGFLYKNGGFEVPLLYALIALHLLK